MRARCSVHGGNSVRVPVACSPSDGVSTGDKSLLDCDRADGVRLEKRSLVDEEGWCRYGVVQGRAEPRVVRGGTLVGETRGAVVSRAAVDRGAMRRGSVCIFLVLFFFLLRSAQTAVVEDQGEWQAVAGARGRSTQEAQR